MLPENHLFTLPKFSFFERILVWEKTNARLTGCMSAHFSDTSGSIPPLRVVRLKIFRKKATFAPFSPTFSSFRSVVTFGEFIPSEMQSSKMQTISRPPKKVASRRGGGPPLYNDFLICKQATPLILFPEISNHKKGRKIPPPQRSFSLLPNGRIYNYIVNGPLGRWAARPINVKTMGRACHHRSQI